LYLIASIVRVLMLWNPLTCEEPIQAWLLIHQIVSLCLFLGYQTLRSAQETRCRFVRPACISGRRCCIVPFRATGMPQWEKVLYWCMLSILALAFLVTTSCGIGWFMRYVDIDKGKCWPEDFVNQVNVLQLELYLDCTCSFFFVMIGARVLFNWFCRRCKARSVANDARAGPRAALGASSYGGGLMVNASDASFENLVGPVPLQTLLSFCPEARCHADCNVHCSICQDFCQEGQELRTVVVCGHQYHGPCLETWLINRPTCPNCNQDVTTPVV